METNCMYVQMNECALEGMIIPPHNAVMVLSIYRHLSMLDLVM